VARNVQKILTWCDGSLSRHIAIACPILHQDWKSFSFKEVTNLYSSGMPISCSSSHHPEINELLQGCLQVLEAIDDNSIPMWEDCTNASKIFQSLVRIESICNILHVSDEISFLDTKARLMSTLRIAASRVLKKIPLHSYEEMSEPQEEDYMMLLRCVLENPFKQFDNDLSSGTRFRYIHSCNMMIDSLVKQCGNCAMKSTMGMIEILDSTFEQDELALGGIKYLVLTNYVIVLLNKFSGLCGTEFDTERMKRFLHVIKKRVWIIAQNYCFQPPKDADFFRQNQSMVLIAEVLRFCSTCPDTDVIPCSSVGNKIVEKLRNFFTSDFEHPEIRSVSYLVGCFAMTQPSRDVRQDLTSELLLANLKGYDVFLTPLCALARGMEIDEYDEFLSKLTSNVVEVPATAMKLRIMHMIILSATDQSQIDLVAKHSPMIMNNCLQVMTQVARQIDTRSNSILEVSSLVVEMASKKDVMILRERDIALILARITSTIRVEENSEETIKEIQFKAYEACFSLVSFFLQRFSKQMHSCVPSLVICLAAMLQFALRKSLPEQYMSICGQKFSRLCELMLPHGDIYKKHVICLILRFVNSLQGDMNPVCKKGLLPGIYCLLDIIREHESMQLNSMLDEECRALLRSIHEGYKKIHVYKGQ